MHVLSCCQTWKYAHGSTLNELPLTYDLGGCYQGYIKDVIQKQSGWSDTSIRSIPQGSSPCNQHHRWVDRRWPQHHHHLSSTRQEANSFWSRGKFTSHFIGTRLIRSFQTIKFKGPGEESLTISSHDRTIASLKSLIADVKQQIASIAMKVNSLSKNAQEAVLLKNRVSALAALRSRKAAEATLAQRLDTLSQLEGVYDKIEQAVDQVTLVRVMEASTGVLRSLHAEVDGVVSVENVMENLRDEMDKVDDIGNAIEVAGQGDAAIDESAIDNELEALVRQSQLENEEKEAFRTRQRLATVEVPEDANEAARLLDKQKNIKERRPAILAPSSADTSAVDPLDRISLDEIQAPKIENSQAQTKMAESLPSGVAGGWTNCSWLCPTYNLRGLTARYRKCGLLHYPVILSALQYRLSRLGIPVYFHALNPMESASGWDSCSPAGGWRGTSISPCYKSNSLSLNPQGQQLCPTIAEYPRHYLDCCFVNANPEQQIHWTKVLLTDVENHWRYRYLVRWSSGTDLGESD